MLNRISGDVIMKSGRSFKERTSGFAAILIMTMFVTSTLVLQASAGEDSRDYMPHDPVVIASDAGFLLANGVTDGTGTELDPYEIAGWEISGSAGSAISITGTTKHFSVSNCKVKGSSGSNAGILLTSVSNGEVEHTLLENNAIGLKMTSVTNMDIDYNTFKNNPKAIMVEDPSTLNIDYNSISGSTTGIQVTSGSNTTMLSTNIDYNTIIGGDEGIRLTSVKDLNVDYNTISGAKKALILDNTVDVNFDYNTFIGGTTGADLTNTVTLDATYNVFQDFTSYAIVSVTSDDNDLNLNNFIDNGGSGKQAKATAVIDDDWDGNYWNDWTTPDTNGDKIVDVPYELDGGEALDNTPVAEEVPGAGVDITPLTVTASGTPKSGDAPLGVAFVGSGSGGVQPYTYSWDFGDGGSSTKDVVTHIYADAGTYDAKLTVTDFIGQTKTAPAITITVSAAADPLSVKANADTTSGDAPLAVSFTSTITGGVTPYAYKWNFGDGSTGTSATETHTFATEGTYTVSLTVTDNKGTVGTSSDISITVSKPVPTLVVVISASKILGDAPLRVDFTSLVTGGEAPYTYQWAFGDGDTSTDPNPMHKYGKKGTYTVKLTVTDALGTTKDAITIIVVKEKKETQPGFEAAILVVALALVFLVGRRRKD